MSDVFISYARGSQDHAHRIAEALRGLGYGVWRDDELPAHRDYSEVIEERLRAAKAVVVAWSAEAVKSQWLRAEADIAREAGTLVQTDHAAQELRRYRALTSLPIDACFGFLFVDPSQVKLALDGIALAEGESRSDAAAESR